MTSVGSYEAKTHLPELLERVAKGEKIMITKRGQPIAMLVPPVVEEKRDVRAVIKKMKELRRGNVLAKDLSVRELIDEGRRY
jgi:prevent-host-death family protein